MEVGGVASEEESILFFQNDAHDAQQAGMALLKGVDKEVGAVKIVAEKVESLLLRGRGFADALKFL